MREADFLEAIVCGFLVALTAALFVEYFGIVDIGPHMFGIFIGGLALINFGILLLIGWPFRFSGVFIFFIITMVLGYAAYGPYAEYVRGPMDNIRESIKTTPGMMERQLHCLSLIMTDPRRYDAECGFDNQVVVPDEKPENYGFEITNFETLTKDIYAGTFMQIETNFENKGDYPAKNVLIEIDGGSYRECDNVDVLNVTGGKRRVLEEVKIGEVYNYRFKGKINDPWLKGVSCTYAKNKAFIGGNINLEYSYDYQTESYIDDLRAIRSSEEIDPKYEVKAAREKAAPGNVLMHTFSPLIWEEESFREAMIPISFKNERVEGSLKFRGINKTNTVELESGWSNEDWCKETCEKISEDVLEYNCIEDCLNSITIMNETYHYCKLKPDNKKINGVNETFCRNSIVGYTEDPDTHDYAGCWAGEDNSLGETSCKNAEDGIPLYRISEGYIGCLNSSNKVIKIKKYLRNVDKDACMDKSLTPVYKVEGGYSRSCVDNITIYIVGNDGKTYVDLTCGEGSEDDLVSCSPVTGKEDTVVLRWKTGGISLNPGESKPVYSGVKLILKDFPDNANIKEINFGVKADATYRLGIVQNKGLTIYNLHYTR